MQHSQTASARVQMLFSQSQSISTLACRVGEKSVAGEEGKKRVGVPVAIDHRGT